MSAKDRARAYALWIERRRATIVAISIVFAAACALVAARISVLADFSYLLPQTARSVKDLRAIEQRARVIGTALVAVESDEGDERAAAATEVRDRIVALGENLVASVTFDRKVEREFAWANRWLYADLADLRAARDALVDELARAKLAANPLYVGLDDPPASTAKPTAADRLRAKLRDAEAQRDDPALLLGDRDRVQLLVVHLSFSTGDIDRDRTLVEAIDRIAADIHARHPSVAIGVAGDAAVGLAEHDTILSGMLRATAVTVALVMFALAWYFRSALAIGALSWSLVVGTIATYAFAQLVIGYLNAASAFLSSIVIGNGVNVGILLTARYLEELRGGATDRDALANAIRRTIAATFAAALTAAVAYASLVITVFRGFRHFGVIGGVGILACWASAYVVLPAALSLSRAWGMRVRDEAPLGRWLAAILPRRLDVVALVMVGLTLGAGGIAFRYLFDDPFESNFRNLRSHSDEIAERQKWMSTIDRAFGQGVDAGFVIAVPTREAVAPLVARLRAIDRDKPERARLFASVRSIDDLLPTEQGEKLAVLAELRALLSSKDMDALDDAARAEAVRLRPPDDLHALGDRDLPDAIAWPFIEADDTRGRMVLATVGKGYEVWDAHDTVRFADNVRALELPDDVHFGGASFVFADVIDGVLVDGPRATLAAAGGALLVVLLVLGVNRYAAVTLACGASGTLLMIATSALLGFKVNFLDFVALPITIGIGIEYAVNVVGRARQDADVPVPPPRSGGSADQTARRAVATTGSAVFLCSYTTIVGYGSLLLSNNLGIRSFGLAAMIGEITCLVVAMLLAPALLALLRREAPAP
jgi:predicted RND superfamily exporter protein